MQRYFLFCFVWICLLIAAIPAGAATPLDRIQAYLDTLQTFDARFDQRSSTGEEFSGTIFLRRGNAVTSRLKISYDDPLRVDIFADGNRLIYHDKINQQLSFFDLKDTPALYLLHKDIRLNAAGNVTGITREDNLWHLTIDQEDKGGLAKVTLVFSDAPMQLVRWSVIDPQGIATDVTLSGIHHNRALADTIFEFRDPRVFKRDNKS